jgi:hypothetical protein
VAAGQVWLHSGPAVGTVQGAVPHRQAAVAQRRVATARAAERLLLLLEVVVVLHPVAVAPTPSAELVDLRPSAESLVPLCQVCLQPQRQPLASHACRHRRRRRHRREAAGAEARLVPTRLAVEVEHPAQR